MDFRDLALRDRDDAGYAVDILHPITGEPMMNDGKPCQFICRGEGSKAAAGMLARIRQQAMQAQDAFLDRERLQQNLIFAALPFVGGFVNCIRDGQPMTGDDAEWWLDLLRWEIDADKAENPDVPLLDKMAGYPFPVQVLRAVATAKATLGNA